MAMMISKFHKLIASKVFWGIFALTISVSFVGVSIPGCQNKDAQRRTNKKEQLAGRLWGEEVMREELAQAYRHTHVSYTMMLGRDIQITDEIDAVIRTAAWSRIAALKKARQLGMFATPEQTIALIQRQSVFQNQQTGQFDKNIYDAFVTRFLPRVGMTPKGLEALFAEQVLIEKVSSIPAQGGLVSEEEIKKAFHLYADMLTVKYAALPRSLASTHKASEQDAENYFELNKEKFRMPEKVIVDYVQFAVADYTSSTEVSEAMALDFYNDNKQRYLKEPSAESDPSVEPECKPFEEVKEEVVELITQELARREAVNAADTLVSELADNTMTFKKVAESLGLTVADNTPAFTRTDSVKDIDPTAPFQRAAFGLDNDETHYYSDPVIGRAVIYVLSLNKKLDSFLPSFEVVKEAATEAAQIEGTEKVYTEKVNQIHGEIKVALASGSSFSDATAKYKLEVKTTEPFSVTSSLSDEFGQEIKLGAILSEQGALTDLISTPDGYLIAYVAKKVPGDEVLSLPFLSDELVKNLSNEKSARLIAEWRKDLLKEAGFVDLTLRDEDNDKS